MYTFRKSKDGIISPDEPLVIIRFTVSAVTEMTYRTYRRCLSCTLCVRLTRDRFHVVLRMPERPPVRFPVSAFRLNYCRVLRGASNGSSATIIRHVHRPIFAARYFILVSVIPRRSTYSFGLIDHCRRCVTSLYPYLPSGNKWPV